MNVRQETKKIVIHFCNLVFFCVFAHSITLPPRNNGLQSIYRTNNGVRLVTFVS